MQQNNNQNNSSNRGLASADEETRKRVSSLGGQSSPGNFANRDRDEVRDIASRGGHAAQESGHAHRLTDEERSRGGQASPGNFANRDRNEVAEIGRRGGQASHRNDDDQNKNTR